MIAVANTESLVTSFALFFDACKFGLADRLFRCTQYDNHGGRFIVPLPATLMEEARGIRFPRLIKLCGSARVLSLPALKLNSEIDWGLYTGDDIPFLSYSFETVAVSDII